MPDVSDLVGVATNAPEVVARLKSFSREQLPFATALSLTRLAYAIRDAERARWTAEFKVRSKWTTRQITADLTRKKEWPNPTVKVGDLFSPAAKLETGGTKRADAGYTDVFVPTRFVAAQRSPTTGRVPAALNAKSLVGRDLVQVVSLPGLGRALVLKGTVGRTESGRLRFGAKRINQAGFINRAVVHFADEKRALYLLRSSVVIPERFKFGREAREVTSKRYAHIFLEAMEFAQRTARR